MLKMHYWGRSKEKGFSVWYLGIGTTKSGTLPENRKIARVFHGVIRYAGFRVTTNQGTYCIAEMPVGLPKSDRERFLRALERHVAA